ncbi:DEAD/DEAH box helicase [Accumulibacter sp.]|uniref:preprotein translocase subunit SecA n=1 Tax=Accumulibacter sp. TaxID=2053492 RepID=UPI002604F1B0|nr:DEAD/DEAH box helicase [Accumulibacter sp.]
MHAATSTSRPTPGLFWGAYPERSRPRTRGFERLIERAIVRLQPPAVLRMHTYRCCLARVAAYQAVADTAAGQEARLAELKAQLARGGLCGEALAQALALVAAHCRPTLGMAPFDHQLIAARALLDGLLVEMATGEGKTLAVAIAAAVAALAGIPVHVITANDYLVERDGERLAPLYAALGLRVGCVVSRLDGTQRRAAYACDITYCTAKELGFDYLRDRAGARRQRGDLRWRADRLAGGAASEPLLRGLCMAIVDEADSVLIDEARVPLILARSVDSARERADHALALELASQLKADDDFTLDAASRRVRILPLGEARLAGLVATLPASWHNRRFREEWIGQALSALHCFHRDRDYIVRDHRVEIVDPTTGRVASGRTWSRGLHQMIELKENCAPTPAHVTAAQITFQRLFRRYHRLAGVSGTLAESASELAEIYGLHVLRVPLRQASQRRLLPTRVMADRAALWAAVSERAADLRAAGRPVLIGTDSVADSEALARTLASAGIDCRILNARQDRAEAETVALAGLRAQVTVTTNMAGRGTDIPLGTGVAALGGLHVISCQHNASRRIDRQLLGRCARQGQPGSAEALLGLDSDLLAKRCSPYWLARLQRHLAIRPTQALARFLAYLVQRAEEARERAARRRMLLDDERTESQLALGGEGD